MTHLVQSLIGIIPHSTITKESVKKTYGTYTRLTSFYCTSLFNSQMLHCLQIEGLWQACVVYWYHFSNSICLLHVSVSQFSNFTLVLTFSLSLYLLWWYVISDLWCYYCNCLWLHEQCPCEMANSPKLALPRSLFLLGASCSLVQYWESNTEIRPINNPILSSMFSSERKRHTSLTLNQSQKWLILVKKAGRKPR